MNNRKHLFRLIKTYPTKDKVATCVYGRTREKLQIESSPGNRNRALYRIVFRSWLHKIKILSKKNK